MSFVADLNAGKASMKDIDNYIDEWHDGDSKVPLHEYLGMSELEYEFFIHSNNYKSENTFRIMEYLDKISKRNK